MKYVIAALAAFFVPACTTPNPEELPTCQQLWEHQLAEHKALHHDLVNIQQVSIGTYAALLTDAAGNQYGLMVALPGSLVPREDSPFHYVADCREEDGIGRLYKAKFDGQPRL